MWHQRRVGTCGDGAVLRTFSFTFSKLAGATTEKQTRNTSVCGYESGLHSSIGLRGAEGMGRDVVSQRMGRGGLSAT